MEEPEKIRSIQNEVIPLCINKVMRGQWNDEQASLYFSQQIKKLNPQEKRRLIGLFNDKLREAKNQLRPKSALEVVEYSEATSVSINGPSSIGPNQTVTLTATTTGLPTESYQWSVQGSVPGVSCDLGETAADGSNDSFIIRTLPECGNGTLYITAIGLESKKSASVTIQIIGTKDQTENKESESTRKQENSNEKSRPEKTKQKKDTKKTNRERLSQLRNLFTADGRKALWDNIKKRFTKQALAGLWKALLPYLPWIILGIVIIIFAIILYSALIKKAHSGEAGSTIHEEVDLANDTDLMEKVILSTGDQDAKNALTNKTFPEIQENLLALKNNADTETQKKIASTSDQIDQYVSNSNNIELGKEIVKNLKEVLSNLSQQAPTIKIKTRSPLDKISDYNSSLHFGTPLNKELPKDGQGHGTYMFYGQAKADAVDLYGNTGSNIYAVFPGKIIDLSDDGTGHKKMVINYDQYDLLYANFDPADNLHVGQDVDTTTPVGKIVEIDGESQLHVELSYEGKPIVTTLLDQQYHNDQEFAWGYYLWANMRQIFNLK